MDKTYANIDENFTLTEIDDEKRCFGGFMELAFLCARVAAQFTRSAPSSMTVDEIAGDARKFAKSAALIRRALAMQKPADRYFSALDPIAARYSAEVVRSADLDGMAVGLRFRNGTHRSGFRDIFFVA